MDNSTLQDENKITSIVNNLTGATRWMDELNLDIPLSQSSSGFDHVIKKFKDGHVRQRFGSFLTHLNSWESFCRRLGETSMTNWCERLNRLYDRYRDSHSAAICYGT